MTKRIGLVGYFLEVNSFAPVTTEANFRALCHEDGARIAELMRQEASVLPVEVSAFAKRLDAAIDWEPVPASVIASTPGGPVDQDFYDGWLAGVRAALEAGGPLDAVYIANHGAGAATGDKDSDGTLYAMVREVAGPDVPVIATTDLHANISDRMVDSVDVLITYRTNPHVDQRERATEAAEAMLAMFDGMQPQSAFIRLPICPPSVTLLTKQGPFADLVNYGQSQLTDDILNVSIFGNFTFADLPKNGIAVVVTAKSDQAAARALCRDIAQHGWDDRQRYKRTLTPMADAIALAVETGRDADKLPHIYSDAGDNPGGGGPGRTTWLLAALHEAGAQGVLYGVFHDPALAAEAHEQGEGATFTASFNRDYQTEFVKPFTAQATVLKLHDGNIVGRRGNRRGRVMPHGPSALLQIGGIRVAVASNRIQCYDPMQFEMYGEDVAAARTVVVKSRGHFRAGFDEFFPDERILEVDTAGLTSPVLTRFDFKHLPRPVFPLDEDAAWTAPDW